MSSANGEAEDGHVQKRSAANEEREDSPFQPGAEYGADDHLELYQAEIPGQLNSEHEQSEEGSSLNDTYGETSKHGAGIPNPVSHGAGEIGVSLEGAGRPSSADGSISILDDTPSVQVGKPILFPCISQLTKSLGFFNLIFREALPFSSIWPKSNSLAQAI